VRQVCHKGPLGSLLRQTLVPTVTSDVVTTYYTKVAPSGEIEWPLSRLSYSHDQVGLNAIKQICQNRLVFVCQEIDSSIEERHRFGKRKNSGEAMPPPLPTKRLIIGSGMT
jgi:hypothetical protein